MVAGWTPLYLNDFRGITENGTLREDVHAFEPARPGEQAPVAAMVQAAQALLTALDEDGRKQLTHPVDAVQWQTWANPEFMQFDTGLRLEFQPELVRENALALVRASLSPEGYELAHNMMLINGFLGRGRRPGVAAERIQLQLRALRDARSRMRRGVGSCTATTAR